MIPSKPLSLILTVLFCLATVSCWCQSQGCAYRSPIYHYTLSLPVGWQRMPAGCVRAAQELANSAVQGKGHVVYEAGFCKVGKPFFEFPYILIQQHPRGTPSFSALSDFLTKDGLSKASRSVNRLLAGTLGNARMTAIGTDEKRHLLMAGLECDVLGVGRVKALMALCLGRDGITQLNCYSRAKDFQHCLPLFGSIARTCRYDAGYAFVGEQEPPPNLQGMTRRNGKAVAMLVVLIVYAFSRSRRKRNQAERQNRA